jgi:long-chain acyl-CoA synthetase
MTTRETILSLLDDALARGSQTAVAARHGLRAAAWSYERLATTAFQFARELEAREIGQNDRVLCQAKDSGEWIAAFFGCLLRGVVVVPLDVQSAPDFAARVQQQVAAKLLLAGEGIHQFNGAPPRLPLSQLSRLVAQHSTSRYQVQGIGPDHLAEIIFTSGTTAEPKGVCLTHRNLLANLAPLEREISKYLKWERFVHPLRFLNLVPLSHVFGQFMGIFVPQLLGGEVYFQGSLNPAEIIDTVRRHRISVIVAVPRQLETLRDKIERDEAAHNRSRQFQEALAKAAPSHWLKRWWLFRRIHRRFGWKFWAFVAGGATLNAETENFWQRLGFAVVQGYGMTETASLISVNHPFRLSRGSIGKTLPGQEVKLSESGEIMVRGSNVAAGYWQRGVRPIADAEGWLRTGDVGEMDAEGNLFFKGRSRDVIVTAAGLNVFPEDLEAALEAQPEIRASAVIGIQTPQGPAPFTFLIPRDSHATPEAIAAAVSRANRALAPHQQIRYHAVWPEADFPRTATQKIRKGEVKAKFDAVTQRRGDAADSGASGIGSVIARVSGIAPGELKATANLSTDLKLDSLGRVELLSALEDRYQVQIDEAAITAATTVADLESIIAEGSGAATAQYPYPRWSQRFPVTWLRVMVFYLLLLPLTRLMAWPRVRGREHLRNLRGPVLFISNHVTMTDQSLIQAALPGRFRRRLAIAMEGERLRSYRHPPEQLAWFTRLRLKLQYVLLVALLNVFPLPQQSGFRRSFSFLGETMDRGWSVLVFPEGRRTEDGRMAPFRSGIGLLATSVEAPVVPVRIDGLFELKQRRQYFARPGRVSVTFGEPRRFAPGEDAAVIAQQLAARVASLAAPAKSQ